MPVVEHTSWPKHNFLQISRNGPIANRKLWSGLSKEETPLFIKLNSTTIAGKGSRTGQRQPSGILILLLPPCCHCLMHPWPLSKAPSVILTAFISFYLDYNDGIFLFVCANRGGRFWCLLFWGPAMPVTVAQKVPDISLREKSKADEYFCPFQTLLQ